MNKAWVRWAKRFNAQNKIYPEQDKNNWLTCLSHCRACIDDQALAFGKAEGRLIGIFEALIKEIALDLVVVDDSDDERMGSVLFEHTPSGLRFWVNLLDNEDFKAGKEVYLYGFYPEKD